MIPYGRQDISPADIDAVRSVLEGEFLTTGPAVADFESAISAFVGGTPTFAVSSGTAALQAAYAGAGITTSDEIITTPLTFVATQATAILLGASIVFADVRPDTGTLDPANVESLITPRTKAIVTVDYAGNPVDLEELRRIANAHGILLIEDAAHSLGSTYKGAPVGSIADITTFSFFPTKNVTTGEGGAVAALDPSIFDRAKRFARQGLVREPDRFMIKDEGPWHQEVHEFGLNYRLPDILAALGLSQLNRISDFKERRRQIKSTYDAFFKETPELTVPVAGPDADPLWHLYPLRVPSNRRREMVEKLREAGIGVQVNYIPAYWHPAFSQESYPRGLCPIAEDFYQTEISLPLHTRLTDREVEYVATTVIGLLKAK
jgi:perosamine synthetase